MRQDLPNDYEEQIKGIGVAGLAAAMLAAAVAIARFLLSIGGYGQLGLGVLAFCLTLPLVYVAAKAIPLSFALLTGKGYPSGPTWLWTLIGGGFVLLMVGGLDDLIVSAERLEKSIEELRSVCQEGRNLGVILNQGCAEVLGIPYPD